MPLLPSSGQLYSMCSLKSSNLRVVLRFAPFDLFSSTPLSATQLLVALGAVGSQPLRSFPSKIGSGFVHAAGALRFNSGDRKSTRLNSSHQIISYAVFCLK